MTPVVFEVTDIWADFLQFSAPELAAKGAPEVSINGKRVSVHALGDSKLREWRVEFDFAQELVEAFEVSAGTRSINIRTDSTLELLFGHDLLSTTEKVQRRGALKHGRGFQLVASCQTLLWVRQLSSEDIPQADNIRIQASAVCSIAYRYVRSPNEVTPEIIERLQGLGAQVVEMIDISTPDARWYPSVQLALGQLLLVSARVPESLEYFIDISEKQERLLLSEPVCAFNIALSNCLLTYFLNEFADSRLERFASRWEFVFRFYPANMDIRFGTMQEFGRIYDALFANYRIALGPRAAVYPHYRPVTFEELMQICIRVNLSPARIRKLKARLFPEVERPSPPAKKQRRKLSARKKVRVKKSRVERILASLRQLCRVFARDE